MPTVYSSVFQNFIRQGFSKSFTHGYAQSVVAATHPHVLNSQNRPSFARRSSNRLPRLGSLGLQAAFHSVTSASTGRPQDPRSDSHGSLDAYFENLQKKATAEVEEGDAGEDWVQFQFPKRIEWRPSPASILLGSEARAYSSQGIVSHDGSQAPAVPVEAETALAHIDAAIEKEIEARKQTEGLVDDSRQIRTPAPSRALTPAPLDHSSLVLDRPALPATDPQSQSYSDHLTKLAESSRYGEIPAVFEAMLVAGITPAATAYNALLMAAIHLPSERNLIISKALDVYADMRGRKVSPDGDTFNILVGLLAARSLEVASLKKILENKRLRFGGVEEPGKFMLASHQLEHDILTMDDRLDLALKLFGSSLAVEKALYSSETYHELISACAQAGRVSDMLQLYEHMESAKVVPFAATFPAMITAFASSGDLVSAVECYNEYRSLAIGSDEGQSTIKERLDAQVYAAVINAYVVTDKLDGAMKFYTKIIKEYGAQAADIKDALIAGGFVKGLMDRGIYEEALRWANGVDTQARSSVMSDIATLAADHGHKATAVTAFGSISGLADTTVPAMALLALSVREGDVNAASRYWQLLCNPDIVASPALIEPTAMFAVALIGSGQVAEGLTQSEWMFQRIKSQDSGLRPQLVDEIDEASEFIARFMTARGIVDPRETMTASVHQTPYSQPVTVNSSSPYTSTPTQSSYEDNSDPYAHSTDFKGSSLISDELEGSHGRKGPRLNDALVRFRNIRRAGRHPRYITYAKLITAAARDGKMDLCQDILAMARSDVPFLPQYAVVRYGWSSILDAMVGACLTTGNRRMADHFHQELLDMGATPSANTFGLYITTLKESTKTFDEASEAVKIFLRAKAEGVEPSSFLYNALIGKLGKARRIDDCLFYFAEMRALGIKPTSVTYGTIVNALCRVSDDKFAEELFDEMEAMPNYKARPAPYNSMMQFFLTTKQDRGKVLAYYERMKAKGIAPTAHTYKLLVDTHATLEPVNMEAAEAVLDKIRASGMQPEPVHYAALVHAKGCVLHDVEGARRTFDSVVKDPSIPPSATLYQALFEAMVANRQVAETEPLLKAMLARGVQMTAYIANTLIHGWASAGNIIKASEIYKSVGLEKREPSTYEAMTRAFLSLQEREQAKDPVREMLSRGYPSAVVNKVLELLGGGSTTATTVEAAAA
jgi:pentatricopeptide repeat protein